MGNLIDYIAWRDESGQAGEGLTPVDLATLSRAAYLPLSGVVPESMGESVPLPLAMERSGFTGVSTR